MKIYQIITSIKIYVQFIREIKTETHNITYNQRQKIRPKTNQKEIIF
jgi:hypothetical protein